MFLSIACLSSRELKVSWRVNYSTKINADLQKQTSGTKHQKNIAKKQKKILHPIFNIPCNFITVSYEKTYKIYRKLCTLDPRFHQLSWYGCDLPTQSRRWRPMGLTLIVNELELAPVLYGTRLPTSESWKAVFCLVTRGSREICWYDLHGESKLSHSHSSTMVYPIC